MPAAPASQQSAAAPLTPAHYNELALAQERARPVRKAARVAGFNGWTSAVLAVLSAPFAPFSTAGLAMTLVLAVVAFNELRGKKRLLNFDPPAATMLGWNQLGFMAAIALYCAWSIWSGLKGPSPLDAELRANPELNEFLGSPDGLHDLYSSVVLAFYGSVIALTVIFQGFNAVYYFTRRKYVEACLRETPEWALTLLRSESGT